MRLMLRGGVAVIAVMARAPVGLWLHTDAPRGAEILQLLADAYGIDGIAPDDKGHARLYIEAPDDIPAYLAVMGTLARRLTRR